MAAIVNSGTGTFNCGLPRLEVRFLRAKKRKAQCSAKIHRQILPGSSDEAALPCTSKLVLDTAVTNQ
jgi:hypothetical protein